jgi:two-component system, OmpR family, sensor kinase
LNKLERQSFFSFLTLYIVSSITLLTLSAFWYFHAQKEAIQNIHYYKMQHLADNVSSQIISAHMNGNRFKLMDDKQFDISLYDVYMVLKYGSSVTSIDFEQSFYTDNSATYLISKGSNDHLGIRYVVISSSTLDGLISSLRTLVLTVWLVVVFLIAGIGWWLSKIFLKPVQEKILEIETFIKDMTHELNTPITALLLSSKKLSSKQAYDAKTVHNISISTKQLSQMYDALSFSSFDHQKSPNEELDLKIACQESIDYFDELLTRKNIDLEVSLESVTVSINRYKASMLINNILSNAIKYSAPQSKISITLNKEMLYIEDEGIGIDSSKLKDVFKRFSRASDYTGGFGIGLSVVKRICDEYNFNVEITSTVDVGTTIKVLFQ